jgi:RimJ/RimL family protein N-acetyltransferase
MLQDNADDFSNNKYFLAEDRFTGHPVALAMLCKIDWKNRHAEYAYIIGERDYRAKLTAGDLNLILYNHFFNGLNLNKVYGFVFASNAVSHRMNSFGGACDGTLRMHRFQGSLPSDVCVFSITRAEFAGFVNRHADTLLKKHVTRGLIQCPAA